MKFFLFSMFMFSFTFAQTRPTGGVGPDVSTNLNPDESFKYVVSRIETAIEMNFDVCQTGMIRPKTFNLLEIYHMLTSMYALNYLTKINDHKHAAPSQCDNEMIPLTPQMKCLIKGSESDFGLLYAYPRGGILLRRKFNLSTSEVNYMIDFLNKMRLLSQTQTKRK